MSAKDRRKKVSFDHNCSSAATDSPSTDSSSGDLPIILPPAPDTPLSGPMPKRNKGEPSLSELQENIITALTLKMNQRADSLEQMIITNSNTIEDLKTSLNHLYVEIQDLKNDKTKLAEKFSQQQKSLVNLEERIADAERYKQRWCPRLYGLSEQPNKDVKAEVLEICNVLAPESCQKAFDVIDIAHRLGKPQPGRIRAVIILFTLRSVRDAVWRNGKNNEFLKQRKLRFMEDLTKEEKDKRSLLWQESV
ncbi:hypothetical protein M9458_052794 [Cirrhinus mrigala]|uniref:Uncharacterized protein n=1 Tax=Cirrhinus mrigala TaxID=683832 RepID=A0ABD0MSZ3_CIRMR